ncbi:MAG: hypothetical protein RLZZ565_1583, partial [Planctomycetota bacterium]
MRNASHAAESLGRREQFLVGAAAGDPAVLELEDRIAVLDGREAV